MIYKKRIFTLLFSVFSFHCAFSCPIIPKTIIKTNILNTLIIPSLHLEHQAGFTTSLQFNMHRGSVVFISPNEWLNISLNIRKYFGNKRPVIEGIYAAAGLSYHYNILGSRFNKGTQETFKGEMSLGPEIRFGYQKRIKKSKWYIDTNIGTAIPFVPLQPYGTGESLQARLFLGIGYRLSKESGGKFNF